MDNLKQIIESILFVSGDGVAFSDIAEKLQVDIADVKNAVNELKSERDNNNCGIQIMIFNDKAQLCSNPNYANEVSEVLNPIKEKALTKAVLEVVAIIAYKQPITRLEVENVRGVNSDYAINTLLENNLIEIVGRKDAVGKPLLFGTTDNFLKKFGLTTLNDLPDYEELLERIDVLHNPEKDNSLFDFRDTEDEINHHEQEEFDPEKLKEDILNDKESFEGLLEDEVDSDEFEL